MRTMLTVLLVAGLALAGCFGSSDDPGRDGSARPARPTMPEDPMPEGDGHDHGDPAQHQFLWNYDVTAHDPLLTNALNSAGLHALDIAGGYLFGAVWGSHVAAADGGLVVWDLADPAVPVEVGRVSLQGAIGGDRSLEVTPDGDFAVLAAESLTCFGQVTPQSSNAYLIDTSDKTAPRIVDQVSKLGNSFGSPTRVAPNHGGYHSVTIENIDGNDYVWLFGELWMIAEGPLGGQLVSVDRGIFVGHDLFLQPTPDGRWFGIAAQGEKALEVYDLTVPEAPVLLAQWDLQDRPDARQPDGVKYYFHTADMAFLDDGQVLVFVNSEDAGDHTSPLWILDATGILDVQGDPMELEHIGTWVNPGDHPAGPLTFSLHNPRWIEPGVLAITHYHGGVWVLDFRPEAWRGAPAPIGYAVYAEGPVPVAEDPLFDVVSAGLCNLPIEIETPTYMDVAVGPGGELYTADPYTGLYTFVPTEEHPLYA